MSVFEGFAALVGRFLLGWFFLSQAVQRLTEWDAMVICSRFGTAPGPCTGGQYMNAPG